jgi:glycosyltransferase involved in cell wall biosynthesis
MDARIRMVMRIAHITNNSGTNLLGIERHVINLAAAQRARGHDSIVVTDRPAGFFAEACDEYGIPMTAMPDLALGPLAPAEQVMRPPRAELDSVGAALIHCHSPALAAQAIPASNRANIPCVLTLHGFPTLLLRSAQQAGLKFSLIAVCRATFEELSKSRVNGIGVYYVPNGTKIAPLARRSKAPKSDPPNLIMAGTRIARKGMDLAILAMAELRRRRGTAAPTLRLYGEAKDPGYEKYLREMTVALSLDDTVQFCGFRMDILDHCASTNILLVPSRSETGPLVVLEAMSRGMPVVASDVGEVTEMLPDQRYGRVVPVNSILALADGIESMISDIASGNFDPELVIERQRSLYSTEKMAESTESVYKQILAEHS